MGMGAAKTHIYDAIDDYNRFKNNSADFELEILERVENLEASESNKAAPIQFLNDNINKLMAGK